MPIQPTTNTPSPATHIYFDDQGHSSSPITVQSPTPSSKTQNADLHRKGSKEFLQTHKVREEAFIQKFDYSCWAAGLSFLLNDDIKQTDIAGYYPKEARQDGITPNQLHDLIETLNKRLQTSGSNKILQMTGDYPSASQLANFAMTPFLAWCRNDDNRGSHVYIAQKFDNHKNAFTLWDPYTNNHYECNAELFVPRFAVFLL